MNEPPDAAQRKELGNFIRACRERLAPDVVGLPSGPRRRTPGLRREEIAQISGLSATWYTWLEQGRDISVSSGALARLAGALRLTRAERAYLFELAGRRDPGRDRSGTIALPAAVEACVHAVEAPAYVLDRTWTARAWNDPAARLFPGWLERSGHRNLLRWIFLSEAARHLIHDYETRARRVVFEFRADISATFEDPAIRELVGDLRRESPLFARLWEERSVLGREGGPRTFDHPWLGHLSYHQVSFDVSEHPGLKLTMLLSLSRPDD